MKYVAMWETKRSATEEELARSQKVFSKWTPDAGVEYQQFLGRVDGGGGFAIVESDDPTAMAKDMAVFHPYLAFTLYPVIDMPEMVAIGGEATAFRQSIS